METRVKRTQRDYTLAFKLAVVEQVEKGELTYRQAQRTKQELTSVLKMSLPLLNLTLSASRAFLLIDIWPLHG